MARVVENHGQRDEEAQDDGGDGDGDENRFHFPSH
jgi:hypothetical protein